jgi:hypothetical protein
MWLEQMQQRSDRIGAGCLFEKTMPNISSKYSKVHLNRGL